MISRRVLVSIFVLLLAIMGMGGYALHLKRRAEAAAARQAARRPLPTPVAMNTERVRLYVAVDETQTLRTLDRTVALPKEVGPRAHEILRELFAAYQEPKSTHRLPEGSDVRELYMVGSDTAVIDTTPEFADKHRSGITAEMLTIASIMYTLRENVPQIKRVKILVDGKERPTLAGHIDLTVFHDVNAF